MKKKAKFVNSHFRFINIYLNELKEIEQILQKDFDEYTLDDGDEYFDNLDELVNKYKEKKKINKLNFECRDSFKKPENRILTLGFEPDGIHIASFNDESIKGTRLMIEDILRKSVYRPKWLYSYFYMRKSVSLKLLSFLLIIIILSISVYAYIRSKMQNVPEFNDPLDTTIGISFLVVIGLVILFTIFLSENVVSINLIDRNSEVGFFTRNKDRIILVLIGAIVGAVVTVILTKLIL